VTQIHTPDRFAVCSFQKHLLSLSGHKKGKFKFYSNFVDNKSVKDKKKVQKKHTYLKSFSKIVVFRAFLLA